MYAESAALVAVGLGLIPGGVLSHLGGSSGSRWRSRQSKRGRANRDPGTETNGMTSGNKHFYLPRPASGAAPSVLQRRP